MQAVHTIQFHAWAYVPKLNLIGAQRLCQMVVPNECRKKGKMTSSDENEKIAWDVYKKTSAGWRLR